MTLDEALKILGLENEEITEEKLKKRYHELLKENHPDANLNDKKALEKTKELNEAYSFLKNYISKEKNFYGNRNDELLKKFKEEAIQKIERFIEDHYTLKKEYPDQFEKIHANCRTAKFNISGAETRERVREIYDSILASIKKFLVEICDNYFEQNCILSPELKNKISFDIDLKTFWDSLYNTKVEYFKSLLDLEIKQYVNMEFYSFLKNKIQELKDDTFHKVFEEPHLKEELFKELHLNIYKLVALEKEKKKKKS